MPKRRRTGANLLTIEQLMAVLNMTKDEIMTLVSNGIPHIKRDEPGRGVYYLFPDREVLAVVKPLPFNRTPPVTAKPVVEEEEDEPVETVRPDPRPVPSMDSTSPPQIEEEPPAEVKKPVKKTGGKAPTKPSTKSTKK